MKAAGIIFLMFFVPVGSVFAAQISFSFPAGDEQRADVEVRLDTMGERINAIRGEIQYSSRDAEFVGWHDGNSIVNLWIRKPYAEENRIFFEGVIPGGFEGSNGLLLTLQFRGTEDIALSLSGNSQTFLNDGEGTSTNLSALPFRFTAQEKVDGILEKDTDPPEAFVAYITQDSNIFEGRKVLIFSTQDKKSGIAHYEVRETPETGIWRFAFWHKAESPYPLRDQALRSIIEVQAIDHAGNRRKIIVRPLSGEEEAGFVYSAIAGATIFVIFIFVVWFRLKRHS